MNFWVNMRLVGSEYLPPRVTGQFATKEQYWVAHGAKWREYALQREPQQFFQVMYVYDKCTRQRVYTGVEVDPDNSTKKRINKFAFRWSTTEEILFCVANIVGDVQYWKEVH